MDYNVLQEKAKEYGIKYHRVGRKDLEDAVKRHEALNDLPSSFTPEPTPPVENSENDAPPAPPVESKNDEEKDKQPEKKAAPVVDEKTEEKPQAPVAEPQEGDNVAVVYKGSQEIRRYAVDVHGETYATLAKGFAAKNKLRVVFTSSAPVKRCENCGAVQK